MNTLVAVQHFFHVVGVQIPVTNFLRPFKFLGIIEIRRRAECIWIYLFLGGAGNLKPTKSGKEQ